MSTPRIFDAIIVGGGPAGLSAALGLARVKRTALVLSHAKFRNDGIKEMHTVLGHDKSHPADFRMIGRQQIERYGDGIQFAEGEAAKLARAVLEGGYRGFEVETKDGKSWWGRKLVLALGSRDVFPAIEGYAENWPENIYQCLFCDGRERSHLPIGMIGFPAPAFLTHVMMACHLSGEKRNVTIFANDNPSDNSELKDAIKAAQTAGCVFETRKITKLERLPKGEIGVKVCFDDGKSSKMGFLVDKPITMVVGENMMVDGLGIEMSSDPFGGSLVRRNEPFGETNVKGCFVAGDAGTWMKQVTLAMTQGVGTAAGVSAQLCGEEGERALAKVKQVDVEGAELSNPVIQS